MSCFLSRRAWAIALLLAPAVACAPHVASAQNEPARNPATQSPDRQAPPARQAAEESPPAPGGGAFKSFEEKLSYVLGVNTARRMQVDKVEPDPQAFARGFIDTFSKKEPLLTDEEMTAVLDEFRTQLREKAESAAKQQAADWDAAFKQPAGEPKQTPSGLAYEVLVQGKGKKPTESDVVVVNYVGKFKDGKVFDSSIARGEPAVFPVNGVIEGWTEGLQLMAIGSKYRFQVPSKLAYKEEGYGEAIPPNSDLTFEVELVDILPQDEAVGEVAPPADAPESPQE